MPTTDIDAFVDALLDGDDWWMIPLDEVDVFVDALEGFYAHGFSVTAGEIEALRQGMGKAPYLALDWNLQDPRVRELIEAHAAESVTNVNNGTKYFLREQIKEFVDGGLGTTEALERVKYDVFGLPSGEASKFTRNRLKSIINYEMNRAMSGAAFALRGELGLETQQWFTNRVSPCELCLWNAAQGVVGVGFDYRGVFGNIKHPPSHPRTCRCMTTAVESEVHKKLASPIVWPFVGVAKGGAGSGNFGHAGREGQRGGSSASKAGYLERRTAMQALGIKYASRMNQYIKYGMPSVKEGRRRYIKWPEAQTWWDAYSEAGKGKAGVEAANAAIKQKVAPPELPLAPKPPKKKRGAISPPDEATPGEHGPVEVVANNEAFRLAINRGFGEESDTSSAARKNATKLVESLPQGHLSNVQSVESLSGDLYLEENPQYFDSVGLHWNGGRGSFIQLRRGYAGNPETYTGSLRTVSQVSTLTHEIGHSVHAALDPEMRRYPSGQRATTRVRLKGAGVQVLGTTSDARRKTFNRKLGKLWQGVEKGTVGVPREYAKTNEREFFAVSYSYYRHYPAKLRSSSQTTYDLFKDYVFRGKEYG